MVHSLGGFAILTSRQSFVKILKGASTSGPEQAAAPTGNYRASGQGQAPP